MIKRALISVSDKEGITEFARELSGLGIELMSTGGTFRALRDAGIDVIEVSRYTEHPEIMDGRVKTLHPRIHGGILAVRKNKEHMKQLEANKIKPIDMVIVNLYPFQQVIQKGCRIEDAIENIDIGGPSMLRSAAKNYEDVVVVVDKNDYAQLLDELRRDNGISQETRKQLSVKAFQHTAQYDTVISEYLHNRFSEGEFPSTLNLSFQKVQDLRYGENPHQKAAFYKDIFINECCVANSRQLHGKELSYNNILDMNDAFELIKEFKEPTTAVIKHTNPSGVATRQNIEDAFNDAYEADPLSAFGCIVALNRPCNKATAELMKGKFIEVVICPEFDKEALDILEKKKNIRLIETGDLNTRRPGHVYKKITGGMLAQSRDLSDIGSAELKIVTKRKPTGQEMKDLLFAWKVNKHVKSNSIVYAKDLTTVGIGAGQMSRVDAAMIGGWKAKDRAKGAVMSSDAFFPFRDGIDEAARAGIKAIIQPGGSIRDEEVIKAADEHGIAMVFSGIRLFKH